MDSKLSICSVLSYSWGTVLFFYEFYSFACVPSLYYVRSRTRAVGTLAVVEPVETGTCSSNCCYWVVLFTCSYILFVTAGDTVTVSSFPHTQPTPPRCSKRVRVQYRQRGLINITLRLAITALRCCKYTREADLWQHLVLSQMQLVTAPYVLIPMSADIHGSSLYTNASQGSEKRYIVCGKNSWFHHLTWVNQLLQDLQGCILQQDGLNKTVDVQWATVR